MVLQYFCQECNIIALSANVNAVAQYRTIIHHTENKAQIIYWFLIYYFIRVVQLFGSGIHPTTYFYYYGKHIYNHLVQYILCGMNNNNNNNNV